MTMWLAVILVGLGSYAFRLLPLLLGERIRLSKRADATLRRTAIAAMTALMVLALKKITPDPLSPEIIPVGMALAISGAVAVRRRSMATVVLCGAVTYGVAVAALRMMIG